LVLHGLATTTTLHVSLPTKFNASPYALKIFEFISINYDLSIPGYLAYPPRQNTQSTSSNKTFGSLPI